MFTATTRSSVFCRATIRKVLWLHAICSIWLADVIVAATSPADVSSSTMYNGRIPEIELNSLYDLWNATDGVNWLYVDDELHPLYQDTIKWNFALDNPLPCAINRTWFGIDCNCGGKYATDNAECTVIVLYLNGQGLDGTIPDTISGLSNLESLSLQNNHFPGPTLAGTIPASIGNLSKLVGLYLESNELFGSLPESLGALAKLNMLHVSENKLSGEPFPTNFAQLTFLNELKLSKNSFSGPLSKSIENLKNLRVLSAAFNSLSGTFPNFLCSMINLEQLYLGNNHFSGSLPSCIGNLTNLLSLNVQNCAFSGQIPTEIGNMTALQYLYADHCFFSGSMPESFGQLENLKTILLHNNKLEGPLVPRLSSRVFEISLGENRLTDPIPFAWGNIVGLQYLYLQNNLLTGSIPESFEKLEDLLVLSLNSNKFTGRLLDTFPASWKKLLQLILYSNQFHSSLPSTMVMMKNITSLLLQNNKFKGVLPEELFDPLSQKNLSVVQLSSNRFTGQLPNSLFALPSLTIFAGVSNCFGGTIPKRVCNSTSIKKLMYDGLHSGRKCRDIDYFNPRVYTIQPHSHFNSQLHSCFFDIPQLELLHMSGLGLTATLPSHERQNSTTLLTDLVLSHNSLTGTVPTNIQNKPWLRLDLSFNRLDGSLHEDSFQGISHSPEKSKLFLKMNHFTGVVPKSFKRLIKVKVLTGNMFSCHQGKNGEGTIPSNDKDSSDYDCGSDSFNTSFYVWLAAFLTMMAVLVYIWLVYYGLGCIAAQPHDDTNKLNALYSHVARWLAVYDFNNNIDHNHLHRPQSVTSSVSLHVIMLGRLLRGLRRLAFIVCCYICVVLCPVYVILGVFYQTYRNQYAYVVSAGFLSGKVAFGVLLVFFLGFVILLTSLFHVTLPSKTSFQIFSRMSKFYTQNDDISDKQDQDASTYNGNRKRLTALQWVSWLLALLINIVVVVSANAGFILVTVFRGSNTNLVLAQMAMGGFKFIWNGQLHKLMRFLLSFTSDVNEPSVAQSIVDYLLIGALFNTIFVPCFVEALIDPNCFRDLLDPVDPVTASYRYIKCLTYFVSPSGAVSCILKNSEKVHTKFQPPFIYSFQCSASISKTYASSWVYYCLLAMFMAPTLKVIQAFMYSRRVALLEEKARAAEGSDDNILVDNSLWMKILNLGVPQILRPRTVLSATAAEHSEGDTTATTPASSTSNSSDRREIVVDFATSRYLVTAITLLGLLVTFGAVFPPVGAAATLAIFVTTLQSELFLGRFICISQQFQQQENLIALYTEVSYSRLFRRRWVWVFMSMSCWFYGCILFDTLGNEVGFDQALWVLILMGLLPLVIYSAYWFFVLWEQRNDKSLNVYSNSNSVHKKEGIEMTAQYREDEVAQSALHSPSAADV